jgi:hypothetical protein
MVEEGELAGPLSPRSGEKMHKYTDDDLKAVRDQHAAWLRQQQSYTGSFIGKDAKGNPLLVLGFDPASPAIRQGVEEKFRGYPVEVRAIPRARAF